MNPGDRITVALPSGEVSALFVKEVTDHTILVWPDGRRPLQVPISAICKQEARHGE